MKKLERPNDIGEKNDARVIIVLEDGKIQEPVVRCLGNFENYVCVGNVFSEDNNKVGTNDYEEKRTYCLFGTPSLEMEYFSISTNNKTEGSKITQEDINKKIIIRAKDLMYHIKAK